MAKHPINKPKAAKKDPMAGAVKAFFIGGLAEYYLLLIRRYYVTGTLNQVVAWDSYLKYFSIAGIILLLAGVALTFLWKADKKRIIGFSTAGVGAFLAAASIIVRANLSLLPILIVLVPVVAALVIVWNLYDRECALSLTVLGLSLFVIWAARRAIYSGLVKALVVLFLLALVAVFAAVYKSKRTGDKLGKFQILPAKAHARSVYVSCVLSLVTVATVLVSSTVAYYGMWLLAAVVFALAVYYTVKQL
jgi:hypothetical protein